FKFRDDDVVIATYAKSGTTWVQQIVGQLIFGGKEDVPVAEISSWVDLRVPPVEEKMAMLEAQEHRRFVKTHLPLDALVYSPKAKYIYIARDGRDVLWSFFNHHLNANDLWYEILNDTPGRVGPPIGKPKESVVEYFRDWLEQDGFPIWSYWESIGTWWPTRELPNVLLLHFANLKEDMPGEIGRIAEFLEIEVEPENWPAILKHCSFDYMKANAEQATPLGGAVWEGGAKTFVHKGTNGRWQNELPDELSQAYEKMAVEKLGEECAAWLKTGKF
ncbi:MAG: sulfotransferase domain-containing protein, partial [Rhizobiaceae bacterium]